MNHNTHQKDKQSKSSKPNPFERWITYRPEIKVLDCTIRDGGLMNNHQFSTELVQAVFQACLEAGVDYFEIGYKASKRLYAVNQFGEWKFCSEDSIKRIVNEHPKTMKISVMADAERCDYKTDIPPKDQTVVDMIRVATYVHQIPTALEMLKDAKDKGYETTVNLMAVSTVPDRELNEALELLAQSEADVIYLVDSFGAMYSEQIRYLVQKYMRYARATGKEVGIHAHNNLNLAFANTIEAITLGVNRLDSTICGLGRGAGNCPTELLLGFLHNPKYDIRPILRCREQWIEPLQEKLHWGFHPAYMITGLYNLHPRAAIEYLEKGTHEDIVSFYNRITE